MTRLKGSNIIEVKKEEKKNVNSTRTHVRESNFFFLRSINSYYVFESVVRMGENGHILYNHFVDSFSLSLRHLQ